jgi:peptidoglycan/xylan/chitin deacetylase (PgdA/CDA1 family)
MIAGGHGDIAPHFDVLRLRRGEAWPTHIPWPPGEHTIVLSGPLAPDDAAAADVALAGVSLTSGMTVVLAYRRQTGFSPTFDYGGWLQEMAAESYRPEHVLPLSARLPFHYHRVPGIIRNAVAALVLARRKHRGPKFPAELCDCGPLLVMALLEGNATRDTLPLAVLTHDIDSAAGWKWVESIAAIEAAVGARSCWNVVPRHYPIDYAQLERLAVAGHEIGLHGIWHTNREAFLGEALAQELESLADFRSCFAIRTYRSPSWYRTQAMYDVLASYFDTDLSTLDVDLLCPGGPGGVGFARAFEIRSGLIELPCTLPFEAPLLIGPPPDRLVDFWRPKIELLQRAGGLVVVNTHPDPNYLGNAERLVDYRDLLTLLVESGWRFRLPRDVQAM